MFQVITAVLCAAELAALVWALVPRGRRWGVLLTNIVSGGLAMAILVPELPGELRTLRGGAELSLDNAKTSLLCLAEVAITASSGLAFCGWRVSGLQIWLGFAVNFAFSLFLFFFAFFVRFKCCGYL